MLEELAFKVHEQNVGQEGTADIGEDRLVRAFRPLLNNSKDKADVVVDYIEKRAGLLIGQGEKDGERQFTFPHRTFQEFLAACHLAARGDFPAECARLARAAPAHWQVALPLAARLAKVERGASAADELIGGSLDRRVPRPATAGRHRLDVRAAGRDTVAGDRFGRDQQSAIARAQSRRASPIGSPRRCRYTRTRAVCRPSSARRRATCWRRSATRASIPNASTCPADDMLGFVRIPADPEFRIGTRKADAQRIAEIIGYFRER